MADLRDEIAKLIIGCAKAETYDANFAAGRILAIPELAEALARDEQEREWAERVNDGHRIRPRMRYNPRSRTLYPE